MAGGLKQLKSVRAQTGQPLYATVKKAICAAIESGVFSPGQQMPSTKDLSAQLGVSLVTAHRGLQELVTLGVLERSQGRGTFVHHRYFERKRIAVAVRVGLVFHAEASLADFYHGQILDGVNRSAAAADIDLILLRFGEDLRNECDGYLLVNPFPEEMARFAEDLRRGQPAIVVGAHSHYPNLPSYDVDNIYVAKLAMNHLIGLDHRRIGYIGGGSKISYSRDRWQGFSETAAHQQLERCDCFLSKSGNGKLEAAELAALGSLLASTRRPTAIFAGGFRFALDVYASAMAAGLRVPEELSVVGVDDPPSAVHLAPPMTTIRQPLMMLGQEAVTALSEAIRNGSGEAIESRRFEPELIVRRSTAAVTGDVAEPSNRARRVGATE